MRVQWRTLELETRLPFVTSHGGGSRFQTVLVELEHEGVIGYGEAAPSHYHGETAATVVAALASLAPAVEAVGDPAAVEAVHRAMSSQLAGHRAARAAIDIACHDWLGKRLGAPLWRLLGGERRSIPPSSYTVAIAEPGAVPQALAAAREFSVIKVKMGDDGDVQRLQAVRGATDRPLRVDANGGWRLEDAAARLPELERAAVELVEQPFPAEERRWLARFRQRTMMPVVADEPARVAADLPALAGWVDGINIKLAKCGGVRPALEMVHVARALGLRIMLGCMVESSVGIAAAAALSPLVDWVDLDGCRLLANDPASGVELVDGKVWPGDGPGLGVTLRQRAAVADA